MVLYRQHIASSLGDSVWPHEAKCVANLSVQRPSPGGDENNLLVFTFSERREEGGYNAVWTDDVDREVLG